MRFQEYTPNYLPGKLSVGKKVIEAWRIPSGRPSHIIALRMTLSKSSFIYEQKSDGNFTYSCDSKIINTSCSIMVSQNGLRYVLTTTTIPHQPLEQTIEWLKGDTRIRVVVNGEFAQPYPTSAIERMIDSFSATTYHDLPVTYIDKSRI
ncbi:MAG TPA: hypothetical protein VJR27_00645 [Candidatus Saccharimonadales bacterium]|nr:hypothetical protein [Candidatus Saccharimonadales bacterium]